MYLFPFAESWCSIQFILSRLPSTCYAMDGQLALPGQERESTYCIDVGKVCSLSSSLRTDRWLQLIGFPPCLHVCLCTVCMRICMYAFICGGWYQEFSLVALQLDSLRQSVSVKSGADMASFASQLAPGLPSLCPSCLAHQAFTWVLGIQSQILLLAWHPLLHAEHLPSPVSF